jgi:hypothetical protein
MPERRRFDQPEDTFSISAASLRALDIQRENASGPPNNHETS